MLSTKTIDQIIPKRNLFFPGTGQQTSAPVDRNWKIGNDALHAGYGACYRCPCQAFEGSGGVCSNCGHNHHDHF